MEKDLTSHLSTKQPAQKPLIQPAPPLTPPMAVDSLFPVKQKIKPEVVAMFSHRLAIPAAPDTPNIIVHTSCKHGIIHQPIVAKILNNSGSSKEISKA